MDLDKFIANIKALDPLDILLEAAALGSQELADTNRANLLKGELASGDETEEYASLSYMNLKAKKGSVSLPNMDFKFTGIFHRGIQTTVQGSQIVTGSTSIKSDLLQANWGDDIFTVQEKQFSDIVGKYIPQIINKKLGK